MTVHLSASHHFVCTPVAYAHTFSAFSPRSGLRNSHTNLLYGHSFLLSWIHYHYVAYPQTSVEVALQSTGVFVWIIAQTHVWTNPWPSHQTNDCIATQRCPTPEILIASPVISRTTSEPSGGRARMMAAIVAGCCSVRSFRDCHNSITFTIGILH